MSTAVPDLADVDVTRLSPASRYALREIAWPHAEGVTLDELAERLGKPRRWVADALRRLRAEMLAQTAATGVSPLSGEEQEALAESIRERGVIVPVIVDERGRTIDGHERQRIAAQLGLECPVRVVAAADRRDLALELNLARRHVTREQRRRLVESELIRDPARSDSRIAAIAGVSHSTVAAIRRRLEADGGIANVAVREDTLGRRRPSRYTLRVERESGAETHQAAVRVIVEASRDEVRQWNRAAAVARLDLAEWVRAAANRAVAELHTVAPSSTPWATEAQT